MTVYTVLFHWNLEHLRCGCAVDVASFFKNILAPGFSRKPCQHSGFNGGKVDNDKLAAAFRHKCGADQLRQGIRHILIEYFQSIKVTGADQAAGLDQIRKMVLRQILHLNNASCPATGPVGSVELKHSTGAAVCAYGFLHRLIFTNGGFRKLLAKRKDLLHLCRCSFEQFRNFLLAQ